MATLLISAAINIGIGLLIGFLFPPKGRDSNRTGPQLSDLSVTSSAYGEMINIGYGTMRMGGNLTWAFPPGIQEVANATTQEAGGGKGGGGASASLTTFTYFASFQIIFAEGPADDILRMWGDGKLIYDKTGTSVAVDKGLKFRFYEGTRTQLPDPLMEADKGVGNVSASRGLCHIVTEDWPLADFGKRIPQITAEVAFVAVDTAPFTALVEISGANVPGSTSGSDSTSHMFLDPFSDWLFLLKSGTTGVSRSSVATMSMDALGGLTGLGEQGANVGMNGSVYIQGGSSNYTPITELDPVSLQQLSSNGISGSSGNKDNALNFPNDGTHVGVLRIGDPLQGVEFVDLPVVSFSGIVGNGGFAVYQDNSGSWTRIENQATDADIGRGGPVMQDYFNRRLFLTQESNSITNLWEIKSTINVGLSGPEAASESVLVASYDKGGVDLIGTTDINGWCVLPTEEAIILSNDDSMIKVDMDTGAILASNLTLGFASRNQWSETGRFAFGEGGNGTSTTQRIFVIDTDDLTVTSTQDIDLSAFPDGLDSNYKRAAYDPRNHSLIFSRVNGTNPAANRVVRVLLERADGLGVGLDTVVSDLCVRAGLDPGEFDVTALASDTVLGFTVNRQGPIRSALEPLTQGYLFEGVESDWLLKFVKRGGSAVATLLEDDVGRFSTNNKEFIKETRQQEVELPNTFGVRFADRDKD